MSYSKLTQVYDSLDNLVTVTLTGRDKIYHLTYSNGYLHRMSDRSSVTSDVTTCAPRSIAFKQARELLWP